MNKEVPNILDTKNTDQEMKDSLLWLGKEVRQDLSEKKDNSVESYSSEQQVIIEKLQAAESSQKRVEMFGTLMDDYGLDVMIGVIPVLGDATSNAFSGLYLALEAANAGLDKKSYLKIIGLQVADFAIGSIPILGDAVDYIFKANKMMGKNFARHTEKLKEQARKAGVSENEIRRIEEQAEKLPQVAKTAIDLSQYKKDLKKAQ